jgi:hypothetical protein
MHTKGFKIFTILFIVLFVCSCSKTTLYLSPYEDDSIHAAKKIIVETNDGRTLELKNSTVKGQTLIGYTKDREKIKLDYSSIKSVRIEKTDRGLAVVYSGVALVFAWLAIGVATAPEPPPSKCCPFIYSFDGQHYHFDAEPYGAAICEGLKRTEWSELEHLVEAGMQYKILITNELEETQYIDEIKLIVVDHLQGTQVISDTMGRIHTISNPLNPRKVNNSRGENLTPYFSQRDGIFWQTEIERIDPAEKETLRDEILIEFPKPVGAKKAKLLVNARTSLWGAQMGDRFLTLYGDALEDWYADVNRHGPAYHKVMSWYLEEELYLLQIRVKTKTGWKTKGTIFGSGPFVSKDKVYTLDVSDVPGDTLVIKLTPPANFWNIDQLAVDYSKNLPVNITEIEPVMAFDHRDKDVSEVLIATDNTYLILSEIGDSAEVTFLAPPQDQSLQRTVILKACGYYDIHLDSVRGEPRWDIIERLYSEPGFTHKFAMDEYLNWESKNDEN